MPRLLITLIGTMLLAMLAAEPMYAGGKKKVEKEEIRPGLPMPDTLMTPVKPMKGLHPVAELTGKPRPKTKVVTGEHMEMQYGGIDVSHYQGQINWREVARNGKVRYVFVKATESNSLVDNTFAYNVKEAREYGIPVGCYHFFRPNVPGKEQLNHFIQTVDMSQQDVLPMIDIEIRGKQSLAVFQKNIRDFLEGFERHYGFRPIIYASANFYNDYLAGAFDNYKYMIAKYSEGIPQPKGPIDFVMWQYSSSGRVPGIRGNVDMSHFMDHNDVKDILIKNNK